MRRVLGLVEQGMTDRNDMAELLEIDRKQVDHALVNLCHAGLIEPYQYVSRGFRKGRDYTIYRSKGTITKEKGNTFGGVSFIFWVES